MRPWKHLKNEASYESLLTYWQHLVYSLDENSQSLSLDGLANATEHILLLLSLFTLSSQLLEWVRQN